MSGKSHKHLSKDRRSSDHRVRKDRPFGSSEKSGIVEKRRLIDRRFHLISKGDRRISLRHNFEFPIIVSLYSKFNTEKIICKTINFNSEGIRAESSVKLPIDSPIGICLYPPEIFIPILGTGKILWRTNNHESRVYQYGISFKPNESDYVVTLEAFIKKQLKKDSSIMRVAKAMEKFIYQGILKRLIAKSQLGSTSLKARADSGLNFDHIYRNQPVGYSLVGKYIDKLLLRLPAAKATRERKENFVKAIRSIITRNNSRGILTRIVDLGSGPSRYVIEAIMEDITSSVEAICIDLDRQSVEFGKTISQGKHIRYIRANVFKTRHLQHLSMKLQWIPNLVIASGLIYYYDDFLTKQLMKTIYDVLDPGGTFLFSNMVSNPNSKLIGKLFVTQEGAPWIPIARSPFIIKRWLSEFRFTSCISTIDQWGMYALFLTKKPAMENPADEGKFVLESNSIIMRQETQEFRHNGVTFRGQVYLPYQTPVKGIVLFVHGLGYCTKSYQLDPQMFVKSGYLLYTYNLRGHGGSDGEWSLHQTIEDVKACVYWLSQKYRNDSNLPIGVLTHSTGALIGILATLEEPLIKFGSLVSPVTSIFDSFMHWHQSGYNQTVKSYFRSDGIVPPIIESYLNDYKVLLNYRDGKLSQNKVNFPYRYGMLRAQSFRHLSDAIAFSPDLVDKAEKINFPIIVFTAQQDEVMLLDKIYTFYEKISSVKKRLIKTNSTNHFLNDSWPLIQKQTIEFFDNALLRQESHP